MNYNDGFPIFTLTELKMMKFLLCTLLVLVLKSSEYPTEISDNKIISESGEVRNSETENDALIPEVDIINGLDPGKTIFVKEVKYTISNGDEGFNQTSSHQTYLYKFVIENIEALSECYEGCYVVKEKMMRVLTLLDIAIVSCGFVILIMIYLSERDIKPEQKLDYLGKIDI